MKTVFNLALLFVLAFILLLAPYTPVFAQFTESGQADGSVVDPVAPAPVHDLTDFANNLFTLIYNQTFLPFAVPAVVILTAISKRLFPVKSNTLAFFWTVFLWALWVVAQQIGYGGQFETMVTSMASIGSALLGITITPILSGRLYSKLNHHDVALIGQARPLTAKALDLQVGQSILT